MLEDLLIIMRNSLENLFRFRWVLFCLIALILVIYYDYRPIQIQEVHGGGGQIINYGTTNY